ISNYEEESQRTLTFNNEEEDTLEEVTEEADEIFIKDINESLSEEVNAVTGEKPPTIEEKVEKEKIVEEKEKEESSVADKKVEEGKESEIKEEESKEKKDDDLGSAPKVVGKIDIDSIDSRTRPVKKDKKAKEDAATEDGSKKQPIASSVSYDSDKSKKKKRKRIFSNGKGKETSSKGGKNGKPAPATEIDDVDIQKQIQETLARIGGQGKSKSSKYRREKRAAISEKIQEDAEQQEIEKTLLKVTEFVTAQELATMMDVEVNEVISSCISLGLFVSINQRLDAETLSIVAEEFGFETEFVSAEVQESIVLEDDNEEQLEFRPPIITVMGHVDHGKTSLLDFVRETNVIGGESGGITQHIGAYHVELKDGKILTFLDTPGHEAFTAMRARGAQITDVVVIVVAADDDVMPQTKEAINHAQAAGVPMVFAINKVDKENANPDKIKEQLSNMEILVEDWGGKYQSQDISAKVGTGVDELLEKILLEAEMLELKANPNKNAQGTIIESTLDKGKGYVTTLLVEAGTLRVGDIILAGQVSGRVKAMHDERGKELNEISPSMPVSILGLNGAVTSGDKFNVLDDEREAKGIASRRQQLQREQGVRTQKHITLDEIGRRLAIGDFKELNVIVKGDVDGSVEAVSDALLKLSREKIQINVIHKSVGQIIESDVLLASASDAIIIGFQVRPSGSARKLADKEEIDIRFYSVIYDAVEELEAAMEGMLDPEIEEKVVCNIEIREVFKISKVGTIAGCFVTEGKVNRNTLIRVLREGIVVHSGKLSSLKRFKDDVKEVMHGYECGLSIDEFNDIQEGDVVEGYEEVEVKQRLK
ncbi:MAG: translation initiation factor IF-2, partial [Bacteroidetes bacterium]|nr:translation initiation factor IF-2 [Bacteroidota bacterium]